MKKIFVLSLLIVPASATAIIVNDWNGVCGAYKYDNIYAAFQPISYECAVNTYLPKQTAGCVACPFGFDCSGGTFAYNETTDQGIVPHSVTCNSGYFLPASSETCTACPTGYSCAGGSFYYDRVNAQGLTRTAQYYTQNEANVCAANYHHIFNAVFTIKTLTCDAGQYLPMGVDVCTPCPANSYCLGGTYTFNTTTDQGISGQCENGYSSTAGSSACSPNTITVRWDDGNGGAYTTTCSYGGTLTTPSTPPVAPKGYHFTGWTFD